MKSILVFKTSVITQQAVSAVSPLLNDLLDARGKWNFDLEDCDKILRVEALNIKASVIAEKLKMAGFDCEELGD